MAVSVFIQPGLWSSNGSAVTYQGSVGATGQFLAADGTQAAPAYAFTSQPGDGFYSVEQGDIGVAVAGARRFVFSNDIGLITGASFAVGWSSNDSPTKSNVDVSLSRGAANRLTLAVGDVLNLAPTAFASLPTGAEGDLASVTDSSTAIWGATIAGGGANNVLAHHNGTAWTVFAA